MQSEEMYNTCTNSFGVFFHACSHVSRSRVHVKGYIHPGYCAWVQVCT